MYFWLIFIRYGPLWGYNTLNFCDMKPITSILLVAAIISYYLLTMFTTEMGLSFTGFDFSSIQITRGKLFALMPFASTFFAIVFNSLKNRYWGILVVIFIVLGIHFFITTGNLKEIVIDHLPEAAGDTKVIQGGLPISGTGIGYTTSMVLMCLALLSALISMLPFKFNTLIEQSKAAHRKKHNAPAEKTKEAPEVPKAPETPEAVEAPAEPRHDDHSAYMPH